MKEYHTYPNFFFFNKKRRRRKRGEFHLKIYSLGVIQIKSQSFKSTKLSPKLLRGNKLKFGVKIGITLLSKH